MEDWVIQAIIAAAAVITLVAAGTAWIWKLKISTVENRLISDMQDKQHADQVNEMKEHIYEMKDHLSEHIRLDDNAHDKIREEIKDVDKKIDRLHDKLHDKLDDINKNVAHLTGFVKKNINGNGKH